MALWHQTIIRIFMLMCIGQFSQAAQAGRQVISLNGPWELAEGALSDQAPLEYSHQVPVPGNLNLATPAFEELGVPSERREAFWCRREFKLEGEVPLVAQLKLHKALYGAKVWLNGQCVGEHLPSFTPGYFDLREALKGNGEMNELLVRLGAERTALGGQYADGWDYEKKVYVPGLIDDVELILTGAPHLKRVQVVPDLERGRIGIQTEIENIDATSQAFPLRFEVRERASGQLVQRVQTRSQHVAAGETQVFMHEVALPDARLWSPEDPFLYELNVSTGGDTLDVTFGMRSFAFNPETHRTVLNGRERYFSGTNFCFYRFLEDPECAALAWDEDWVRALHRKMKSLNWDLVRYTIGFPPEFWYRIADEEGILIQDEMPVWYLPGHPHMDWPEAYTAGNMAEEMTEWIHERANHPSVVIWDACNESSNPRSTEAIAMVRGLDLSDRPWENSMQGQGRPTDCWEAHPYRFNEPTGFRISDFNTMDTYPSSPWSPSREANANILLNEYGWLWVDREGKPATLSAAIWYALARGEELEPDALRRQYAHYLGMLSEYWRSYRHASAVMQFCMLSYSRPGGETSDNWIDMPAQKFEPHFELAMREAFSPVGLMIEDWTEEIVLDGSALERRIGVRVINDLIEDWQGVVSFEVLDAKGRELDVQSRQLSVESNGLGTLGFEISLPGAPGDYQLLATLECHGEKVRSRRYFSMLTPQQLIARDGIAVGCVASASSAMGELYQPSAAFDGSLGSRWAASGEAALPHWLQVDLDEERTIGRLVLHWEAAHAGRYEVEGSLDGKGWDKLTEAVGKPGRQELTLEAPASVRFLRIVMHEQPMPWPCSLWEVQVFPAE